MNDIWKDIPGYSKYQASMFGEVRSKKTKKLIRTSLCNGYLAINVFNDEKEGFTTTRQHRLVALAHLPNPENKPEVNHKSKPNTNNHINNLEWTTKSENMIHSYKTENNIKVKFQCLKFENDDEIIYFKSYCEACRHFDRCLGTIWGAVKNQELSPSLRWRGWKCRKISVEEFDMV